MAKVHGSDLAIVGFVKYLPGIGRYIGHVLGPTLHSFEQLSEGGRLRLWAGQ
jgi:hypothetical protein